MTVSLVCPSFALPVRETGVFCQESRVHVRGSAARQCSRPRGLSTKNGTEVTFLIAVITLCVLHTAFLRVRKHLCAFCGTAQGTAARNLDLIVGGHTCCESTASFPLLMGGKKAKITHLKHNRPKHQRTCRGEPFSFSPKVGVCIEARTHTGTILNRKALT